MFKVNLEPSSFLRTVTDVWNGCFPRESSVKGSGHTVKTNHLSTFVSDRGKGRQRQAILGEHPSSFRHDGYGKSLQAAEGGVPGTPSFLAL